MRNAQLHHSQDFQRWRLGTCEVKVPKYRECFLGKMNAVESKPPEAVTAVIQSEKMLKKNENLIRFALSGISCVSAGTSKNVHCYIGRQTCFWHLPNYAFSQLKKSSLTPKFAEFVMKS